MECPDEYQLSGSFFVTLFLSYPHARLMEYPFHVDQSIPVLHASIIQTFGFQLSTIEQKDGLVSLPVCWFTDRTTGS